MKIDHERASHIRRVLFRIYETNDAKNQRDSLFEIIKLIQSSKNSSALSSELFAAKYMLEGNTAGADLHVRRFIVQEFKEDQAKWPEKNILIASTGQAGTMTTQRFLRLYLNAGTARLDDVRASTFATYFPDRSKMLFLNGGHRFVFNLHCPAWPDLIYNIIKSRTRVIFLKRDIFELLSSYASLQQNPFLSDFEGKKSQKFDLRRGMEFSPFYFTEDLHDIENQKIRTILMNGYKLIDIIATWIHAKKYLNFEIFDLKEQQENEEKYFRDILRNLEIQFNKIKFYKVLSKLEYEKERSPVRLGLQPDLKKKLQKLEFSDQHKALVRSLYGAYPNIDFSIVDKDAV